jgi:hypothetical protein
MTGKTVLITTKLNGYLLAIRIEAWSLTKQGTQCTMNGLS